MNKRHMYRGVLVVVASMALPDGARDPAVGATTVPQAHSGMHVTVQADRVTIGEHEFVPRFTKFLQRNLVVPAGQTVTLPADSTWDAIEVAGTLRVSRTFDTTVRFIHLLILPGGVLDAGIPADPLLRQATFIIRDVPLDLARDPFQWGNGILNFGGQARVGRPMAGTWTELAQDTSAGSTSLTLDDVPAGWRVGDELLLPDMRQMGATRNDGPPRREEPISITAINGKTLSVSRPLQFDHLSIREPSGEIVLRPRVANLTRNIVIRSENPSGTRGHTANIGSQASWDIRYNQFVGVGRTTFDDLDSTIVDTSGTVTAIGANQIGKYANHDHHGGSSLAVRRNIGNSYNGTGGSKWAHAVHGTHDVVIEDNVCVDFQGGCFTTEDGYEVRNVFRRNVAAFSIGNGRSVRANINARTGGNSPGGEGSGFWFRGLQNIIEDNESWNNVIGINLFAQDFVDARTAVPSQPGGPPDVVNDLNVAVPISFKGNVTLGNSQTGLEYWSVSKFPAEGHVSAHNRSRQVFVANSQNNHVYLRNVSLIAASGRTTCLSTSAAYIATLEVDGGGMKGCADGIIRGGAIRSVLLRNIVMQNRRNIIYTGFPDESRFERVHHLQLETFPKQFIVFGDGEVWDNQKPLPGLSAGWLSNRKVQTVVDWQGTGQDYVLLELQQQRSTEAWPARSESSRYFVPEEGLTMGEAWDKYGLAWRGDVVHDAAAVELEGLVNGVARRGLARSLGTPRAIIAFPNMLSPAPVSVASDGSASIRLWGVATGDHSQANDHFVISVDGQAPIRRLKGRGGNADQLTFVTAAAAPGRHEVRTWREDSGGRRIAASEMTFHYFVAEPNPR